MFTFIVQKSENGFKAILVSVEDKLSTSGTTIEQLRKNCSEAAKFYFNTEVEKEDIVLLDTAGKEIPTKKMSERYYDRACALNSDAAETIKEMMKEIGHYFDFGEDGFEDLAGNDLIGIDLESVHMVELDYEFEELDIFDSIEIIKILEKKFPEKFSHPLTSKATV